MSKSNRHYRGDDSVRVDNRTVNRKKRHLVKQAQKSVHSYEDLLEEDLEFDEFDDLDDFEPIRKRA